MNYILLCAGKGTRLHPLTLDCPKCLYNIADNYSIIQRMVDLIKKYDDNANINIVVGFMHNLIKSRVFGVNFIYNPFYDITNSVASLWFAKDYLNDDVTIINGDIVVEKDLVLNIIVKLLNYSSVLVDSSIKSDGDYNVQVDNDNVLVMSKELNKYYAEYAGVTKLNRKESILLRDEIETMIDDGNYNQWYEDALVRLLFKCNFKLKYIDISGYDWVEVDTVDDLLEAKQIQQKDNV
jgi:choline kinase